MTDNLCQVCKKHKCQEAVLLDDDFYVWACGWCRRALYEAEKGRARRVIMIERYERYNGPMSEEKRNGIMERDTEPRTEILRYHKLVRDKVPELIEATGKKVKTSTVHSRNSLLYALLSKLREETEELAKAEGPENAKDEIADVLEVLEAIADYHNIKWSLVKRHQRKKAIERGGFERHIILLTVERELASDDDTEVKDAEVRKG